MNVILMNSLRLVLMVLLQALIFNQLEIGLGILPMVAPLFLMLLPFNTRPVVLLLLAFLMGVLIDTFSNTAGLHTSALLTFALFRPIVFKSFSPRDGYDNSKIPSINEMGNRWFLYTFGILLAIHHLWFFIVEMFNFSEILLILQKFILSLPISMLFVVLLQFLFHKNNTVR